MSHSYTYYRSCPYILHDLYLPSIPASFQTLGRVACAVASALAPPGPRIISPLTLTLLSQCFLDACKKIGPEFFLSSICPPSLRSLSLHTLLSPFLLYFFPGVASSWAKVFLPLISPPLDVCLLRSSIFYLAPRVCRTLGPFPHLRVCPTLTFCLPPRS
jgi:hypothetical protein